MFRRITIIAITLTALMFASSPTMALQNARTTRGGVQAGPMEQDPSQLFDFNFKGGTLQEFVEQLMDTLQKRDLDANIIVKDIAKKAQVPALELRSVSIEGAMRLLHNHQSSTNEGTIRLDLDQLSSGGTPIYVIDARMISAIQSNDEMVHVWNVSDMLKNDIKADDLLTAIEAALELAGGVNKASLKFHESTGLIMARGTGDQIGTIEQVVSQLGRSATRIDQMRKIEAELEAAQASKADAARMKDELQSTMMERELMARERDDLMQRIDDLRREREMASAQMQEQQKIQVAFQAELEQARKRNAELEREVVELRKKLESNAKNPG